MESTEVDVDNTRLQDESMGVDIENPGVQDKSHKEKKNEGEDYDMSKISDKDIPKEDTHHPQLTSPTK